MGKLSNVMTSQTPYSVSTFNMKHRSDGRDVVTFGGKEPKPTTKTDDKIHLGHIIGSGQYNLAHDHDHSVELAFDYKRLAKEVPDQANRLRKQTLQILGPIFKKMHIKLSECL